MHIRTRIRMRTANLTPRVHTVCCRVRNEDLVNLGVRLEDRTDGPSAIKFDDPEVLREEITAKQEEAAQAAEKKAKAGGKSPAQRKLELQKQEKVLFQWHLSGGACRCYASRKLPCTSILCIIVSQVDNPETHSSTA